MQKRHLYCLSDTLFFGKCFNCMATTLYIYLTQYIVLSWIDPLTLMSLRAYKLSLSVAAETKRPHPLHNAHGHIQLI